MRSIVFALVLLSVGCAKQKPNDDAVTQKVAKKPNIIYILADDLGYGDLSSYGQVKFQTPHIDQLAAGGMMFTQHYSGAPVCAPARSSLLTGLHTGHTPIRGNKQIEPEGQYPLPDSAYTLTEMMKKAGYVTGAFGKWGLGFIDSEGDPNNQGIDTFYGYNCQRLAHNYYPEYVWSNQEKIVLTGNAEGGIGDYAPAIIHEKALEFLEQNKDTTFFLFYPLTLPHAELAVEEAYTEKFRDKLLPEKNYKGVDDGPNFRKGPYGSQKESHAVFAGMVIRLDDIVGEIVKKVNDLGLSNETIIIFTSDNGPHVEGGADPDYFNSNGGLRGYKRDVYEGGIRVPMIVYWPEHVAPKTTTDHVSAFWDVMPTLAELIDNKEQLHTDGISFLPTVLGKKDQQQEHKFLYWEFHEQKGRLALRQGDWKLVQYNVNAAKVGEFELYNLKTDPQEKNNVIDQQPDLSKQMIALMKEQHVPSPVFKF